MIKKISVGLLAFLLAACVTNSDGSDGPVRDVQPSDYVKLSRTPCFGACPVYDLTLSGDGRVVFHGTRFTKLTGQHSQMSSTGRFLEVLSMLEARGFTDLNDRYTRNECKLWATDHSSVTIEVKSSSINKTLEWYTGCRNLPERAKLDSIVDELEFILDVESFIGNAAERAPKRP